MSRNSHRVGQPFVIHMCLIMWLCSIGVFSTETRSSQGQEYSRVLPETLVFAADIEYPPFSYVSEGRYVGHDIDLIRHISQEIGIPAEIKLAPWPKVIDMLESASVDVVSGILKTPERSAVFEFSIPYLVETYAIFTHTDSGITDARDLPGKSGIALREDASIETFFKPAGLESRLTLTDSLPNALNMVGKGKYDYTVAPYSLGMNTIKKNSIKNIMVTGRPVVSIEYRLAVGKGNHDLVFLLNEAISTMIRTGEYDTIRSRWTIYDRYAVPSFSNPDSINLRHLIEIMLLLTVAAAAGIYTVLTGRKMRSREQTLASLIDSLSEKNRELKSALLSDQATGLFNRRYIIERLDTEIALFERYGDPFSIISVRLHRGTPDENPFNSVSGDHSIAEAASTITAALRSVDIIARLDEDNFLILLPHTIEHEAALVSRKLNNQISEVLGSAPDNEASVDTTYYEYRGEGREALLIKATAPRMSTSAIGEYPS